MSEAVVVVELVLAALVVTVVAAICGDCRTECGGCGSRLYVGPEYRDANVCCFVSGCIIQSIFLVFIPKCVQLWNLPHPHSVPFSPSPPNPPVLAPPSH